ncbi:MAG: hypothetical protein WA191_02075 [Telluria sp.]
MNSRQFTLSWAERCGKPVPALLPRRPGQRAFGRIYVLGRMLPEVVSCPDP